MLISVGTGSSVAPDRQRPEPLAVPHQRFANLALHRSYVLRRMHLHPRLVQSSLPARRAPSFSRNAAFTYVYFSMPRHNRHSIHRRVHRQRVALHHFGRSSLRGTGSRPAARHNNNRCAEQEKTYPRHSARKLRHHRPARSRARGPASRSSSPARPASCFAVAPFPPLLNRLLPPRRPDRTR